MTEEFLWLIPKNSNVVVYDMNSRILSLSYISTLRMYILIFCYYRYFHLHLSFNEQNNVFSNQHSHPTESVCYLSIHYVHMNVRPKYYT